MEDDTADGADGRRGDHSSVMMKGIISGRRTDSTVEQQQLEESMLAISLHQRGEDVEHHEDDNDNGWSTMSSSVSGRRERNSKKKSLAERRQTPPPSTAVPRPSFSPASSQPSSGLEVELIPPTPENTAFTPFMVLLVGLPGSGKSTFAQALEGAMPYKFCRINQDQLKTRANCEVRLKQVLDGKWVPAIVDGDASTASSSLPSLPPVLCPIIDRCNFDGPQRSTWYNIAAVHKVHVDVIVLDRRCRSCIRRIQRRVNHETLQASDAARVVDCVHKQWRLPTSDKGEARNYRSCTILKDQASIQACVVRLLNQME